MSVINYAVEIFPSIATTETDADIGLASNVFRFITGRPGYDGESPYPTWEDTTDNENVWYEGFLIKDSMNSPNRSIDIQTTGNYGAVSGFSFKIRNDIKFWDSIETLGVNFINQPVKLYIIISDVFYSVWQGVVTNNPYDEVSYTFECGSNYKAIHKNIPPNTINVNDFPNASEDTQGKPIPICLGDVAYAEVLNVSGFGEPLGLAIDAYDINTEVTIVPAVDYDQDTRELTLKTYFKVWEEDDLSGYYLRVKRGTDAPDDRVFKITGNAESTVSPDWYTVITLQDTLIIDDATFNSDYTYGNTDDDVWWFGILPLSSDSIFSNQSVSSLYNNSVDKPALYSYNKDNNSYNDIFNIVDSIDTVNDRDSISLISSQITTDGNIKYYSNLLFDGTKYAIHPGWWWNASETRWYFVSANTPICQDYSRLTSIIGSEHGIYQNYTGLMFAFKTVPGVDYESIDELYVAVDCSLTVGATTEIRISTEIAYIDMLGNEMTTKDESPSYYETGTGHEWSINLLPNSYYRNGGNDGSEASLFDKYDASSNSISTYVKVENGLDFVKAGLVSLIVLKVKITGNDDFPTATWNLQQAGMFGLKNVSTNTGSLYTRCNGELFDSSETNNVYNAMRHLLETYDGIPTASIDYDNLPTTRIGWPLGRQITTIKNNFEYLQSLCQYGFIGMFQDRNGVLKFRSWRDDKAVYGSHNNTNIVRDSIKSWQKTPLTTVYNEFQLQYSWNPAAKKYDRTLRVTNVDQASFPLSSEDWTSYVGGVYSYSGAKEIWEACNLSYKKTGTVKQAPDSINMCEWVGDPDIFNDRTNNAAASNEGIYFYIQNLAEWATRQKDIVTYSVPISLTNITFDLLDGINFKDPIYTNDQTRFGWITAISFDLKESVVNITLILEPEDISDIGDIIETGNAYDNIIESGAQTDTITEGAA